MHILKAVIMAGLLGTTLPALAEDAPKVLRSDPNAVRCKKLAITGSLVRKERVCKTNAEWRASMEQQNRDADDLITRNRPGSAMGT